MMSKKEYWKKRWDTIVYPKDASIQDEDTYKLIQLLSEYSGISSSYHWLTFLYCITNLGWLFQFRWGSHHVSQVINAISEYASEYINVQESIHHNKNYHTVAVVLARLKWQLKNTPLSEQGDLYQILQVVEEKTKVKFAEVNCEQEFNQVERNEYKSKNSDNKHSDLELKRIDRKWQYYEVYTALTQLITIYQTESQSNWKYFFIILAGVKDYQYRSLLKLKKLIFDDLESLDKAYQIIFCENRGTNLLEWESAGLNPFGKDNRIVNFRDQIFLKHVKKFKFSGYAALYPSYELRGQ